MMTDKEFQEIREQVAERKRATSFPDDLDAPKEIYQAAGEHAEFAAAEH